MPFSSSRRQSGHARHKGLAAAPAHLPIGRAARCRSSADPERTFRVERPTMRERAKISVFDSQTLQHPLLVWHRDLVGHLARSQEMGESLFLHASGKRNVKLFEIHYYLRVGGYSEVVAKARETKECRSQIFLIARHISTFPSPQV